MSNRRENVAESTRLFRELQVEMDISGHASFEFATGWSEIVLDSYS